MLEYYDRAAGLAWWVISCGLLSHTDNLFEEEKRGLMRSSRSHSLYEIIRTIKLVMYGCVKNDHEHKRGFKKSVFRSLHTTFQFTNENR